MIEIRAAVRRALAEDLQFGDVTTTALLPAARCARGTIIPRQSIVLAGVAAAQAAFRAVDPAIKVVHALQDGSRVPKGRVVLQLAGDARSLLTAERVALNFLQHLSGIATFTARFCEAVRGYPTRILDTRKTTPGLRALEKWAVRLGGGVNHRHSLGDGILIKDNHLALLQDQGITLAEACRRAREQGPHRLRLIVEVQSLKDVECALEGGAEVILLDNMTAGQVREAVALIKGRAQIEVSGGVTLATARDLAAAGADFLSVGALTHSAPAADLSMDIVAEGQARLRKK